MKFEITKELLDQIINRLAVQEAVINYLTTREPLEQLIAGIK